MLQRIAIPVLVLLVPAIMLLGFPAPAEAAPAQPSCTNLGICTVKFASGHTLAPKDGSETITILWTGDTVTFNQGGTSTTATFYKYGDREIARLRGHSQFYLSRAVGTTDNMTLHFDRSVYDFVDHSLAGMM